MVQSYTPTLQNQRWGPNPNDLFDYYKNPVRLSGGNPLLIFRHGGGGVYGTYQDLRVDDGNLGAGVLENTYLYWWLAGAFNGFGSNPSLPYDVISIESGQASHIKFAGGSVQDVSPIPAVTEAMFFPDAIRDLQRAIASVKALNKTIATALGLSVSFDPNRIGLMGESYGATLAALSQLAPPLRSNGGRDTWSDSSWGSCTRDSRVRALVLNQPQVSCDPSFLRHDNYNGWFGTRMDMLKTSSLTGDTLTWTDGTKTLAWSGSGSKSVGLAVGDQVYVWGGINTTPGLYTVATVPTIGGSSFTLTTSLQSQASAFTISNCTWTVSNRRLTTVTAGAFTNVKQGDIVQITAGTGATTGDYVVEQNLGGNGTAIKLATNVAAGNLATGDIVAKNGTVCMSHEVSNLSSRIKAASSIKSYFENGDADYYPGALCWYATQGQHVQPYDNPHDSAQLALLATAITNAGLTLYQPTLATLLDASASWTVGGSTATAAPPATALAAYQLVDAWLASQLT